MAHRQSLHLEIGRSADGRLEGRLHSQDGETDAPFSGVLELLRLLEDVAASPLAPAAGSAR